VTYVFGVFEFNSTSSELKRSGRAVPLEPQPARALALLLERPGDIITREELSAHVWGTDTHVDFNRGLAYCVGQIRAALGDNGDNPRFVQTLPKRGFKFIAPVQRGVPASAEQRAEGSEQRAEGEEPSARSREPMWRTRSARLSLAATVLLVVWAFVSMTGQRSGRPIVAVSAFDNETGDSRYDRTLGAVSDAVVDRLTGLGPERIGVVGNASVLRIPRSRRDLEAIADQTGASHVILAQLQPRRGEVTLLLHLIRLDDGTHLWTRRIVRPAGDSLETLGDEAARLMESGVRERVLTPAS
jgi:DNA-binding winged helix-turn-helix (wHTH) protein/TolB-like protein